MKIYTYKGCSTCRNAVKWLHSKGLEFEELPIREQPPTRHELETMLNHVGGQLRRLFNSSGQDYRSMGLKDRLPQLSTSEALELLQQNGNLIKRPFLLTDDWGTVGFKESTWSEYLG